MCTTILLLYNHNFPYNPFFPSDYGVFIEVASSLQVRNGDDDSHDIKGNESWYKKGTSLFEVYSVLWAIDDWWATKTWQTIATCVVKRCSTLISVCLKGSEDDKKFVNWFA